MRLLVFLSLFLSLNTNADYSKFISCEFKDHAFVQSVAQYIHTQATQNKVIIFDDTPVGFSGRQVSNKGFYLDYDVIDCTLNLTTMTSSCAIVPTSIELKYGVKPAHLTPVYLSDIKQSLDSTKLDSFLDKVVNHILLSSLDIPSLGMFSLDSKSNLKFSGVFPFVSAPAPVAYSLPCGSYFTMNLNINGQGTVSASGGNLFSQTGNSYKYYSSSANTITLNATPSNGYSFQGWSGQYYEGGQWKNCGNSITVSKDYDFTITCSAGFVSVGNWIGTTQTSIEVTSVTGDMTDVYFSIQHSNTYPNKLTAYFTKYITSYGDYEYGDYEEIWDWGGNFDITNKDTPYTIDWPAHEFYDIQHPARSITVIVHGWNANKLNRSININPIAIGTKTYP